VETQIESNTEQVWELRWVLEKPLRKYQIEESKESLWHQIIGFLFLLGVVHRYPDEPFNFQKMEDHAKKSQNAL